MKVIGFLTLLAIIGHSSARKIIIKSNPDRNAELFQDKDFTFSQGKEDTKEPTIFTGDPMKTKTLISENVQGKKNFKFALGTQNGIEIEQVGKLKADNKTLVVKGSYSYTGADGRRYRVRYTADELGFHPITELELDIPDIDPNAGSKQRFQQNRKQSPPVATTKNPHSQSNFINKRYLPPTNEYLPPTNEYLPPNNDFTRGLQAPNRI
ncbi:CLUMA_CG017626, isoform A [Clunio marinus]|uniref:CLUMA_CG017626, isoform A n=1 Tax=Clunio marinus TaxID=568069 RepID=A0A1J1IW99_9DIPT|nr:CLUMA_CG017626, isoform A [Clunio marinus]